MLICTLGSICIAFKLEIFTQYGIWSSIFQAHIQPYLNSLGFVRNLQSSHLQGSVIVRLLILVLRLLFPDILGKTSSVFAVWSITITYIRLAFNLFLLTCIVIFWVKQNIIAPFGKNSFCFLFFVIAHLLLPSSFQKAVSSYQEQTFIRGAG